MKIKTKLYSSVLVTVLLVALFGVILFITEQKMVELEEREKITGEIVKGMFELNILTGDYLLHRETRAQRQWIEKHDSLSTFFEWSDNQFVTPKGAFLFDTIKRDHQKLSEIYSKLTQSDVSHELEDRLTAQLTITSQSIVSNALKLVELSGKEIERLKQQNVKSFLFLIFLLAFLLLINSYFISRAFTKPINQLVEVNDRMKQGDFKVRTDIKTGDEFENLGNALNKTAEALARMDQEHKQIDEAKTRFLSITSHELRSPMTPMKAQLQMLEGEYFGKINLKQKKAIQTVIKNADRLDRIIVDFLEISRIEAARLKFVFKKVSLTKSVNELLEFMQGFMPEKKIKVVGKISKLPVIEVDPDRVSQVLRNLINNAIKFSKDGGVVEVTAKVQQNYLLFSVKDEGIGMNKEDQLQIFEPFFQAEQTIYRKRGGTGLGLAICRGIIESQNGKIWVKSKIGKGTVFYFTVPFKPVYELKPIKILFSGQENVEKKIKELFKVYLGPIGVIEFEDLKKKEFTVENIIQYLKKIQKVGVFDDIQYKNFLADINSVFEINDKKKFLPQLKERRDTGKKINFLEKLIRKIKLGKRNY